MRSPPKKTEPVSKNSFAALAKKTMSDFSAPLEHFHNDAATSGTERNSFRRQEFERHANSQPGSATLEKVVNFSHSKSKYASKSFET